MENVLLHWYQNKCKVKYLIKEVMMLIVIKDVEMNTHSVPRV